MNFAVRVSVPLAGLAARLRAAVRAGKRSTDEGVISAGLPSTSNLRDPAEIAVLSRFDEPATDFS